MKSLVWLIVLVVAVGITAAVLRPDLVEQAVPGVFAGKHRKTVHARATELTRCLLEGNYDRCVEMTNPAEVRDKGAGALKLKYGLLAVVLKIGKISMDDVRIGDVTLSGKNTGASVAVSVKGKEGWEEKDPSRWVRVDGEWYVSLGDG